MRSFPPSYISNAPGHPNPHLAATYMANLNKAAAYAAAAAASRHSVMTATAAAAGPNYGPQTPMATSVTSQEDLRLTTLWIELRNLRLKQHHVIIKERG